MPLLKNSFYHAEVLQQEADSLQLQISFVAAHEIFAGHFPGQPVVPGVCLIQIVKESLEEVLDKKLFLSGASQVKFLQLVVPDSTPMLQINWKSNIEGIHTQATFISEKPFSKMQLFFQDWDKKSVE